MYKYIIFYNKIINLPILLFESFLAQNMNLEAFQIPFVRGRRDILQVTVAMNHRGHLKDREQSVTTSGEA